MKSRPAACDWADWQQWKRSVTHRPHDFYLSSSLKLGALVLGELGPVRACSSSLDDKVGLFPLTNLPASSSSQLNMDKYMWLWMIGLRKWSRERRKGRTQRACFGIQKYFRYSCGKAVVLELPECCHMPNMMSHMMCCYCDLRVPYLH